MSCWIKNFKWWRQSCVCPLIDKVLLSSFKFFNKTLRDNYLQYKTNYNKIVINLIKRSKMYFNERRNENWNDLFNISQKVFAVCVIDCAREVIIMRPCLFFRILQKNKSNICFIIHWTKKKMEEVMFFFLRLRQAIQSAPHAYDYT